MKGRILVSFIMVTMAMVLLSFKPIAKPRAQSSEPANVVNPAAGSSDLIYVGDNVSTGAGVRIFRRDNQGVLTEMPNSPFSTGGKGLFDILGFNRAPAGVFAQVDIGPYELDSNLILNADKT